MYTDHTLTLLICIFVYLPQCMWSEQIWLVAVCTLYSHAVFLTHPPVKLPDTTPSTASHPITSTPAAVLLIDILCITSCTLGTKVVSSSAMFYHTLLFCFAFLNATIKPSLYLYHFSSTDVLCITSFTLSRNYSTIFWVLHFTTFSSFVMCFFYAAINLSIFTHSLPLISLASPLSLCLGIKVYYLQVLHFTTLSSFVVVFLYTTVNLCIFTISVPLLMSSSSSCMGLVFTICCCLQVVHFITFTTHSSLISVAVWMDFTVLILYRKPNFSAGSVGFSISFVLHLFCAYLSTPESVSALRASAPHTLHPPHWFYVVQLGSYVS